jgi:hypothetical protein
MIRDRETPHSHLHTFDCSLLDLADPLTRDAKVSPDLFESFGVCLPDAEPAFNDFTISVLTLTEKPIETLCQRLMYGHIICRGKRLRIAQAKQR